MVKRIRISNETLNCYGTWIRTEGIDLTQFNRNPVLLWMHQRGVVIGMIKDIRVADGEVTGEPWFDEVREESRLAKQQWERVRYVWVRPTSRYWKQAKTLPC